MVHHSYAPDRASITSQEYLRAGTFYGTFSVQIPFQSWLVSAPAAYPRLPHNLKEWLNIDHTEVTQKWRPLWKLIPEVSHHTQTTTICMNSDLICPRRLLFGPPLFRPRLVKLVLTSPKLALSIPYSSSSFMIQHFPGVFGTLLCDHCCGGLHSDSWLIPYA